MNSMKRSQREEAVINELIARKERFAPQLGFVTTTVPLRMTKWNGIHPYMDNVTYQPIPAGSTLRIVMISRFGDVGLTTDLGATYGYGLRVNLDDPAITDFRWTQAPTHELPDQKA